MESPRHPKYPVHRCKVRDDLAIGYWRAGEGGAPLLLVHGFPETKRIFARNVAPLAAAGFDVIVPDLRGVGDSDPAPDGFYDPPAYARDLRALCAALGVERCGAVAGDVRAMVVAELRLRFPRFVEHQCLFNTLAPPRCSSRLQRLAPSRAPPPREWRRRPPTTRGGWRSRARATSSRGSSPTRCTTIWARSSDRRAGGAEAPKADPAGPRCAAMAGS